MKKTFRLYLLLLLSVALNLFLGYKVLSEKKNKPAEIDFVSGPLQPAELQKEPHIVLAKSTVQSSDQAFCYLLTIDDTGRIKKAYTIDGIYECLAYDEENKELYILSANDVIVIGDSIRHIEKDIEGFTDNFTFSISISDAKIHIQSQYYPEKDERLSFRSEKGYFGMIDLNAVSSELNMIPVSIIMKS